MNAILPTTRTRRVNTSGKIVTAKMKAQAKQYYETNAAANAAATAAKKVRASLLTGMDEGDITEFNFLATLTDGKQVSLDVNIEEPMRDEIDILKLHKLVDEKTFLKIVSASIKAVEDEVGTIIANKCKKTSKGTRNVTVKAAK